MKKLLGAIAIMVILNLFFALNVAAQQQSFAVNFEEEDITVMCIRADSDCKVMSIKLRGSVTDRDGNITLDDHLKHINFPKNNNENPQVEMRGFNAQTGDIERFVCTTPPLADNVYDLDCKKKSRDDNASYYGVL